MSSRIRIRFLSNASIEDYFHSKIENVGLYRLPTRPNLRKTQEPIHARSALRQAQQPEPRDLRGDRHPGGRRPYPRRSPDDQQPARARFTRRVVHAPLRPVPAVGLQALGRPYRGGGPARIRADRRERRQRHRGGDKGPGACRGKGAQRHDRHDRPAERLPHRPAGGLPPADRRTGHDRHGGPQRRRRIRSALRQRRPAPAARAHCLRRAPGKGAAPHAGHDAQRKSRAARWSRRSSAASPCRTGG